MLLIARSRLVGLSTRRAARIASRLDCPRRPCRNPIGFRAVNLHVYGKFVGVDFKEKNFQAALRALHSVRSGGVKPFVDVTRKRRERIYKVSPHFATLRDYLEGPPSDGWRTRTCNNKNPRCGEMGPGGFIWALRDAAAAKGHYVSPRRASNFFGSIAKEISAACASGELECHSRPVAEMPAFTWGQLAREIPPRIAYAAELLANLGSDADLERSTGLADTLATDVQFLNYPAHTPSVRMPNQSILYAVSGRYYKSGPGWFSAEARDGKGLPVEMRVQSAGKSGCGGKQGRFRVVLRALQHRHGL